ncbi:MarR family winged helix-turn-helix transcriptional regulator [Streptomyces sp. NPDC059477]|uniref:MarR family winged helix-turn-helix transcriptional regulator n=1 Tax=Streptomyces sp. NPDC059477 TaxID=3346847 RepID=UPI0036C8C90D
MDRSSQEVAGAGAGGHGPVPDHVARIQAEWGRERPYVDVGPQGVIGRLHRLAGRLTEELTLVYGRHGLGEGEFDVLCALRRAGEPYERAPGELAAYTMVTTGAMTKRIDRLERAGLVTRRRAADDQRGRIVALTRPGRELIDRAFTDHMRNERRLLDRLTPAEAATLEALLTNWLARLEDPEPPADARPASGPTAAG